MSLLIFHDLRFLYIYKIFLDLFQNLLIYPLFCVKERPVYYYNHQSQAESIFKKCHVNKSLRKLTINPYFVLTSSHFRPASSAAYAYSLRASLNNCTNIWVKLQLRGSKYAKGL